MNILHNGTTFCSVECYLYLAADSGVAGAEQESPTIQWRSRCQLSFNKRRLRVKLFVRANKAEQRMAHTGVASVNRALSILDVFSEEDDVLTLAELAKRTGLHKSTLARLAESLEKFGYVRRPEKGGYRLGAKVRHLGLLYQKQFRTTNIVPGALRQLVAQLREGASFYIREDDHRVCLHRVDASRAVRDMIQEGDRLPLTLGAAGHVILAFSGFVGARYEAIRSRFFEESYGERDPETGAIACPVFGVDQRFVGALSVSGPRYRIEHLGPKYIAPVLLSHARQLTRVMGGDEDALPKVSFAESYILNLSTGQATGKPGA
jgi:DNA-binding IclR family transcriptional regulator